MYHLELRQFPHAARAFNLDRATLDTRFLKPFVAGEPIKYEDRTWPPEKTRVTVLEGPPLEQAELGLGRGWGNATKHGEDVTKQVLSEIDRGADARPEVELLKDAIAEVAEVPITFPDAIALAAADSRCGARPSSCRWPSRRSGSCCYQGRLQMRDGDEAVEREQWQPMMSAVVDLGGHHRRRAPAQRAPSGATRPGAGYGDDALDQPLALLVGGEQEPADPLQAGDVVDVAVEMGDEDRVRQLRPAELGRQPRQIAAIAPREQVVVVEVGGDPGGEPGGERGPPAGRRRRRRPRRRACRGGSG